MLTPLEATSAAFTAIGMEERYILITLPKFFRSASAVLFARLVRLSTMFNRIPSISQARIDVLPDLSNGLHQLGHSLCRKVLRLHGNDYAICRRQSIQSYHTERRHTVNQNVVVAVFDSCRRMASSERYSRLMTVHKHLFPYRTARCSAGKQIHTFLVMQNARFVGLYDHHRMTPD